MAWIQSHQELKRHLKTHRAATALGISVPALVGHLHCLWYDCLDFAQDGNLTYVTNAEVARMAMWEGDADLFVNTLVETGFLDQDGDQLHVHDWQEYGGRVIEKRKNDRERKARSRNQPIERENLSAGSHAEVTRKSQDTGRGIPNLDKSRVEKNVSSSLVGATVLVTGAADAEAASMYGTTLAATPGGDAAPEDTVNPSDPDMRALRQISRVGYNSGLPSDKTELVDTIRDLRIYTAPKATPENILEFGRRWPKHAANKKKSEKPFPGEVYRNWDAVMGEPVEPRKIAVPDNFPRFYRRLVVQLGEECYSEYEQFWRMWEGLTPEELANAERRLGWGDLPVELLQDWQQRATLAPEVPNWASTLVEH